MLQCPLPTAFLQAASMVASRLVASGPTDWPMVVRQVELAASVCCCACVPHV